MSSQAKRWKVPKGRVYILDDICKGCGFCIEYCPRKVLARAERFNAKGYHPPEVVDAEACVLCGFCELVCPDFAIWTEKDPVASDLVSDAELASGMNPDATGIRSVGPCVRRHSDLVSGDGGPTRGGGSDAR